MKKLKLLLVVIVGILLLPVGVFAEEVTTTEGNVNTEENKKVNVYFFRGDGRSFCAKAEEWFDSIQDEYGKYFTIKDYETWYSADNAKLLEKVADARNETVDGVPYIIIGEKSWSGFDESYQEEMLAQIKDEYEKDEKDRYDIMQLLSGMDDDEKNSYATDALVLILFLAVIGGIGAGVVYARKKTV